MTDYPLGSSMRPTRPREGCTEPEERNLWFCRVHEEFHSPDGEEASYLEAAQPATAIAKLRSAVNFALEEYIGENVHAEETEHLLNLKEALVDFALYVKTATEGDYAEWSRDGT